MRLMGGNRIGTLRLKPLLSETTTAIVPSLLISVTRMYTHYPRPTEVFCIALLSHETCGVRLNYCITKENPGKSGFVRWWRRGRSRLGPNHWATIRGEAECISKNNRSSRITPLVRNLPIKLLYLITYWCKI